MRVIQLLLLYKLMFLTTYCQSKFVPGQIYFDGGTEYVETPIALTQKSIHIISNPDESSTNIITSTESKDFDSMDQEYDFEYIKTTAANDKQEFIELLSKEKNMELTSHYKVVTNSTALETIESYIPTLNNRFNRNNYGNLTTKIVLNKIQLRNYSAKFKSITKPIWNFNSRVKYNVFLTTTNAKKKPYSNRIKQVVTPRVVRQSIDRHYYVGEDLESIGDFKFRNFGQAIQHIREVLNQQDESYFLMRNFICENNRSDCYEYLSKTFDDHFKYCYANDDIRILKLKGVRPKITLINGDYEFIDVNDDKIYTNRSGREYFYSEWSVSCGTIMANEVKKDNKYFVVTHGILNKDHNKFTTLSCQVFYNSSRVFIKNTTEPSLLSKVMSQKRKNTKKKRGKLKRIGKISKNKNINKMKKSNNNKENYTFSSIILQSSTELVNLRKSVKLSNTSRNTHCYQCGLNETDFPVEGGCHDIFGGENYAFVGKRNRYKVNCGQQKNIRRSKMNYTDGCFRRFTDLNKGYDERGCRTWPPTRGKSVVSNRMARLERVLRDQRVGCISSPQASLLPLSPAISLYGRVYVCVCVGDYCNRSESFIPSVYLRFYMTIFILVSRSFFI